MFWHKGHEQSDENNAANRRIFEPGGHRGYLQPQATGREQGYNPAADNDDEYGYHPHRSVVYSGRHYRLLHAQVAGRVKQHQDQQHRQEQHIPPLPPGPYALPQFDGYEEYE